MFAVGQTSSNRLVSLASWILLGAHLILAPEAGEKKILLRNETIVTGTPQRQSLRGQAAEPVSGLYLVQLEDSPPPNWKEELVSLRVELVRPVPEDAFVAHLRKTDLQALRSLPFVRWVGVYRADHKTHPLVQQITEEAAGTRVRVTALLSSSATGLDTALIQRAFSLITRYSKSGMGRIVEGEISARAVAGLAESEAVLWIEPAPKMRLFDAVAGWIIGGEGANNRPAVHTLGYDGDGVTVAVADSGLDHGETDGIHPDIRGRVDGFFYYGALTDAADEHSHGTHVTGIIAGDGTVGETDEDGFLYGLGIAPKSRIVAQRLFDGLGGYHAPESFAQLTTDAVRAGAEIGSNSWGDDTQGRYDITAMEFDALVRDADPDTPGDQPYILEFSAGNAGPGERTIGTPAVAKNVIATGASQNNRFEFFIYAEGEDNMADFSSRGPCEDGRIKPDLVAPGTWIASLQSSAAGDENAWLPISPFYMYQGGTSQSGPQVSGAAAVFVQYYRALHNGDTPSPALVKAALINSAVDMDNSIHPASGGTTFVPNMVEGWGRLDLTELIGADRGYDFTDQTAPLTMGQVFEKRMVLASDLLPLKITLVYTDVPGFPPAIPALVNDLDLEVISPSGLIYRGNQFLEGESVPNAPGNDSINNVEGVHVALPEVGEYIVRVSARKVLEDARRDTIAVDQDFALVFSGDVPFPGQGVLSLDRRAYTVPSEVHLKLIDFDLAGDASAAVTLTSSSHPAPLDVILQPSGSSGVFTGMVQTAAVPFVDDGRLHIRNGDEIVAVYQDLSPQAAIRATARGDLADPVISGVSSTNRFGRQVVSWTTDELTRGILFVSTNGSFTVISNSVFRTNHELTISDLVEGREYRFYLVAVDQAGNLSTNNNNGAFFSFVGMPAAPVLLVDAYTQNPEADSIEIPVTSYTDALDRTGVSYEVWDVEKEGSPRLADLKPFRVVIWRVNDSFYSGDNTISLADQTTITDYLNQGGSFLLSSMEILTRIGPTPFRTNVLQVAEFIQAPEFSFECPECDEDKGAAFIEGSAFEPISAGIATELDYSNYPVFELEPIFPNFGPDFSDVFTPTTNAAPILLQESGGVVGIKYPRSGQDTPGRVVFLSFPLDAVPLNAPSPNNRANLLKNILSFLVPGLNGFGTVSLDNTSYTVPANVVIDLADSDLEESASVTVECRVHPGGESTTVELRPTVRPGFFRGSLTLVDKTDSPGPARLRATHGDLIYVDYHDASANGIVQVAAEIDTETPLISDVEVEPDYELAFISWETSEPTDALVQFGESPILSKTAYHPGPRTSHELMLPALVADRIYYYRVVSRDTAGNTAIDDNNGQLYTFRTLKPLDPPWFDNLEDGATEWSVQDGEDSEGSWRLGVPRNELATEAHSPTHAWGSNLDGYPLTYVQTFLVSPAINLQNGNVATLKFWHNYDFWAGDATWELGRLLLFTNSQTMPITLANYDWFTAGWEQEEFDLSSHIGKVIHLVWAYEMLDFSFESVVHPGWLVDDVEVTVTNVLRGTIQVTNNLAAASFTVTGPTSFDGSGRWMVRSNAVAGEYLITFAPVEYYETPAPQTKIVSAESPALFNGNYAMTDLNQNGISDDWETEKFGEVSASRTSTTDSDGDGMADLAEFIAGTDPLESESRLQVSHLELLPNLRVRITWPSSPNKVYQVLSSLDGISWSASSSAIRASESETSTTITAPSNRNIYLFKIEVIP